MKSIIIARCARFSGQLPHRHFKVHREVMHHFRDFFVWSSESFIEVAMLSASCLPTVAEFVPDFANPTPDMLKKFAVPLSIYELEIITRDNYMSTYKQVGRLAMFSTLHRPFQLAHGVVPYN